MPEPEPLNYESPPPAEGGGPPRGAMGIIFLIVFMDLLGFGIIIPLLAFYVPDFQANPLKVTLLFAAYSICQFIGAPILGAVSDRYGRRPVLAFSQVGSAVGYVLLGLAGLKWQNPSTVLALVYASRIIDGFTGGNISTAQAYISDVTTPENRAKGMGMLGAAFGIGFSMGPALGGLLGHFSLALPGYAAAAFSAAAAVLCFAKLPETRHAIPTEAEQWLHPSRFLPILRKPVLVQLLAISFFVMAAFVMMESTIALFLNRLRGWGHLEVGWYFAYIGVLIAVVQGGLIGRLTRVLGEWQLAIFGALLVAAGMAGYTLLAWHNLVSLLFLCGAVNACGRSIQTPSFSSLLSKFSDRREQGVVFGLYHGLSSLARVAGPVVAGLAYPFLRNTGQFVTAGLIAVAMALWTLMLRQPVPGTAAPEAVSEAVMGK